MPDFTEHSTRLLWGSADRGPTYLRTLLTTRGKSEDDTKCMSYRKKKFSCHCTKGEGGKTRMDLPVAVQQSIISKLTRTHRATTSVNKYFCNNPRCRRRQLRYGRPSTKRTHNVVHSIQQRLGCCEAAPSASTTGGSKLPFAKA